MQYLHLDVSNNTKSVGGNASIKQNKLQIAFRNETINLVGKHCIANNRGAEKKIYFSKYYTNQQGFNTEYVTEQMGTNDFSEFSINYFIHVGLTLILIRNMACFSGMGIAQSHLYCLKLRLFYIYGINMRHYIVADVSGNTLIF
jgi:hypothetical protein